MNYYLSIPLTNFILNGFLLTYLVAQKKMNPINRAYLIYGICLQFWILGNFFMWLPMDHEPTIFAFKFTSIFWLTIGFFFMNFTYVFVGKKRDLAYYIVATISLLSSIISVSTDLIIKGYEYNYWGASTLPGPLYVPVIFALALPPMLYSLALITIYSYKTSDRNYKYQSRLIAIGSLLFTIGTLVSTVIIPVIFKSKKFPPLASNIVLIQSIFVFFAIKKYNFLTISLENIAVELFSQISEGIIIFNSSGKPELINENAKKILKIEEGSNHSILDSIDGYSVNNKYDNAEFSYLLEGEEHYILISQSDIRKTSGSGKIAIFKDITQKKKQEKNIQESEAKISRLYSQIMDDLEIARITQNSLVAYDFPESSLYKIISYFKPVEKVGGDIITYRKIGEDRLDIFFADVSGHGIASAMVACSGTIAFSVASSLNKKPSEGLYMIQHLLEPYITQHFISAVYMSFYPSSGKLDFAYAGHHPIIMMDRSNENFQEQEGVGTLLLALKDLQITEQSIQLKTGQRIFLYSDGLFEVKNSENRLLGKKKFLSEAEKNIHLDGKLLLEHLTRFTSSFCKGNLTDDVSMLLLEKL